MGLRADGGRIVPSVFAPSSALVLMLACVFAPWPNKLAVGYSCRVRGPSRSGSRRVRQVIERSERGSGRRSSQSPPPAGASQEAYHPAITIPPPVSDRLGANEAHCSLHTTLIPRLRLNRTSTSQDLYYFR